MRLSDLSPDDVQPLNPGQLRLSDLSSSDVNTVPQSTPGYAESLLRGGAQGLSLGFADEIAGAGGAALDALKGSDSGLVANYIKNRDAYRAEDDAAKKANPKTFLGGQIGGGLATAAIPGLNIGAAETLGGRALGAAGLGAAAALGNSKADLTQGDIAGAAKDTAIGGALGGVMQPAIEKVVAPAIGAVAGKVSDLAGWAGKKALNTAFDVPEEVTSRYLANPDAVNSALSPEDVSQKLADTLGQVRSDTGAANEAAMSTLGTERDPSNLSVGDAIDTLRKFNDPASNSLADKLEQEFISRSSGGGLTGTPEPNAGFLNEQEMHGVKKTLQGLGEWKSPLPTADQSAARSAAGDINNSLKSNNMDYQTAMGDLSQNIQSKNQLAQKFGIQPDYSGNNESGYTFTDRTLSALKDLVRNGKVDRERILDSLNEQGYGDLSDDIRNSLANEKLNGPGNITGTRKTFLGAAAGGALGHATGIPGASIVGSALGAAGGATLDKYGPQIAKKALDATVLVNQLSSSPGAQRFVGAIQSAASQGQGALAATHFILSQTEPDYQKAVSAGQ